MIMKKTSTILELTAAATAAGITIENIRSLVAQKGRPGSGCFQW